jgi:hypothetical protein
MPYVLIIHEVRDCITQRIGEEDILLYAGMGTCLFAAMPRMPGATCGSFVSHVLN